MTHPTTTAVLALAADPAIKYTTEIAPRVGVSRERVRQILNHAGVTRFHQTGKWVRCPDCGKRTPRGYRCPLCAPRRKSARHAATLMWLTCEVCGVQFQRRRKDQAGREKRGYKHIFCGHRCKGAYLGRTYGWGRGGPAQMVTLSCEWCRTTYTLPASQIRTRTKDGSRHHYCCRPCMDAHRRHLAQQGIDWRPTP